MLRPTGSSARAEDQGEPQAAQLSADRALRVALAAAPLARSETREELAELAKGYLAKTSGTRAARDGVPLPWARMATEQGWPALSIPEQYGGLGLGFAELAAVIEQCGRVLAYPELITTAVLGASLLAAADDPREYLGPLSSGELQIAVAGGYDMDTVPATVRDGAITGDFAAVVDAPRAGLLLVPGRDPERGRETRPGGTALYAVQATDASITPLRTLDFSRSQGRVVLAAAPARLAVPAERFDEAWRTARLRATVALAAEQLGAAAQALDLTLAYLQTREQFGRPIGSFQAVKHRCADMFVELESTRSAVEFAVWAADTGQECLPLAASIAKAAATDALRWIAAETVHLHGGIGFTWEHDAHVYFRRARTDEVLLGDAVHHRAAVVGALGFAELP